MANKPNPADYSPELSGYSGIGKFKAWVQMVLPQVYDDALSYQELVYKMLFYINTLIDDVDSAENNVSELKIAYDNLETYINDWFAELDVQEEVNEKLDQYVSDGTLSALIQPLFDAYKTEIDNTVATQNSDIAVLKSRMDTFASLPDGSTAGDAELEDIRVGYNGTVYSSAGNAVRGQVSDLKSALSVQTESSEFSFTSGYIQTGGIAVGSTVDLTPVQSESYQYAVVNVSEGDKAIINGTGGAAPRLWAFIDTNNKLISHADSIITVSDLIITAPPSATKLIVNINLMQTVIANFGYCALLALPNRIAHVEKEIDTQADKIEQLEGEILTDIYPGVAWERGRFSSTGNTSDSTATDCIRTNNFIQIPVSRYKIVVPENIVAHMYIYSANASSSFVETYNLTSGITEHNIPVGYYLKTYVDYTSGANIDVSVGDSIVISYAVSNSNVIAAINDTLDYRAISDYSTMAIFQTMGALGDSFASGGTAGGYDRSWPQILARLMGLTVTNYSHSGWTTLDWLNGSDYGLTKLLSDDPLQLYMIDFGINDHTRIQAGTMSLGTIADINKVDPAQNADSFYGYYGRIVSTIIAHAPNAKIVLMSVPRVAERVMDEHIQAIAALFELPYMYLPYDAFFTSAQFNLSISNGHPCAFGYGGMATAINRLMSHLMYEYASYFQNFGTA